MNALKIGELAKRFGCRVETIRFYEREGLLPAPGRSRGNFRLYGEAHLDRLTFIRHCRSLDMTLSEIRRLLGCRDAPEKSCGEVNALLDEHIRLVSDRIAQLKLLELQLRQLRGHCSRPRAAKHCQILRDLARPGEAERVAAGRESAIP
jgi:Cd(II)/Pb(II)-responsive transcriptional regulator